MNVSRGISDRISQRRKELNLKLDDIAQATGVARSTASKWCKGYIKDMRIDKLDNLAKVLDTTIDWLLGLEEDYSLYENAEKIPVPQEVEVICASVKEKITGKTVKIPSYINADFAIRFKGNSMINARIFDGDLVFISTQAAIGYGDICAVLIDNEAILRRVYIYENRIELRPENPICSVLNFEGDERTKVRILGKAVSFLSAVR